MTNEGRQIRQLPWEEYDPAVYEVSVEGEVAGYLRYDDGWRWMATPNATVDGQHLLSLNDEEALEFELGFEPGTFVTTADMARQAGPEPRIL